MENFIFCAVIGVKWVNTGKIQNCDGQITSV